MFFDPKMQLAWVDGPLEKLDAFIENCCVDGKRVHPARALDHMSGWRPTARTGICWKSSWRSAQKAPSPSPISPRWMFRWN